MGDSGILASPIVQCHHLLKHALSAWEMLLPRGQNWFLGDSSEKILAITRATIHKRIYSVSVFSKFHGREEFRKRYI